MDKEKLQSELGVLWLEVDKLELEKKAIVQRQQEILKRANEIKDKLDERERAI